MRKYFSRYDARLLAMSAILVTACGADQPTSPSRVSSPMSPATSSTSDTSSPPGGATSSSITTATAATAQTTTAPNTPANFRLESRISNQVRLNWEWLAADHYDLAFDGRTVILNQYYPGVTQDVSTLDLSPGRTYTFRLRAFDQAGTPSAPAELVFETTPPSPPSNLRQLSTKRITSGDGRQEDYPDLISFTPATDNAGTIRSYEVFLDGVSFGRVGGGQTTQFSLFQLVSEAYISIPCGPTALQMRAYDSSLNASDLSATASITFPTYANCPPPHSDR